MKLRKVVLISTAALLSISLAACSNNTSKDNSSKTTQTSKKSSSEDKTISQDKEFRNKFDQIKVGDLMAQGKGGYTKSQVKKLLGEPDSTNSEKTDGIKTSGATWNKGNVSIIVAYVGKNAVSKEISGFKWTGRPAKLDKKAYENIKDGSSYESAVKKYGEPDGLNESLIMGKKTVIASWLTGVKGDNPTVSLTFENNKLTAKTQTDLK